MDSDDEHQPQPVLSRTSSRPHPSPARFVDEQAQRERLGEFSRRPQQERAAVAAAAAASLAVAVQPPAAPAQPDTQLPTVADIASHRPLYDTLSYALQPLWRDICEPAFERYRQASTAKDAEAMAAALVSILQLPAKHLIKQRVPAHPSSVQAPAAQSQRLASTTPPRPAARCTRTSSSAGGVAATARGKQRAAGSPRQQVRHRQRARSRARGRARHQRRQHARRHAGHPSRTSSRGSRPPRRSIARRHQHEQSARLRRPSSHAAAARHASATIDSAHATTPAQHA